MDLQATTARKEPSFMITTLSRISEMRSVDWVEFGESWFGETGAVCLALTAAAPRAAAFGF